MLLPRKSNTQSPVIIIGMHRSGTSMIARLLEQAGLFVGWQKDNNHEARFFGFLNQWLLHQSGASWDHPEMISNLLKNDDVRHLVVSYMANLMATRHAISYTGWRTFWRYRDIGRIPFPWGWKDPRSTYTLPLWLDLFPQAKVIHIVRHGVDVAHSLQVRYHRRLTKEQTNHPQTAYYWWHAKRREGFVNTLRCASLDEGILLWRSYVEEAQTHVAYLKERAIELKYEDFLQYPLENMILLTRFAGLLVDEDILMRIVRSINADRAFAYRRDLTLQKFAVTMQDHLQCFGYGVDGYA